MSVLADAGKPPAPDAAARELALQKLVTAFISTGLAFLLLPGTFLGVWNLVAISNFTTCISPAPHQP